MARTSSILVQGVLAAGGDYNGSTDLTPYIDAASIIVSRIATCATNRGISLSTEELEIIERWLAAHAYAMSDQPYLEKETERARGKFQGQTKMHFEATKYGQMAMDLDYSGCLSVLNSRKFVRVDWLGKRGSEQLDVTQRD
jgi:ATP phosphoribosyltransferase